MIEVGSLFYMDVSCIAFDLQIVNSLVCLVPTGKLGHGDTNRVYKPKVIEALQGMFIRKVCAGSQSSLALTSTGQVSRTSCD